jgi:hypothetical protein
MEVSPLIKSVVGILDNGKPQKTTIERLSFETNPYYFGSYSSIYIPKEHLVPDFILKRVSVQDDLIAAIVRVRSCQLSVFGRPQQDRFSNGFKIEPMAGVVEKMTPEQKAKFEKRISEVTKILMTCGDTNGWDSEHQMTMSQFLYIQARSAVVLGRFATEAIWKYDPFSNKRFFHSFRPTDAGTMYRAVPQRVLAENVREEARKMLEKLKNKQIIPEKFVNDEYTWIQVVEGKAIQAFGPQEMIVYNCYPSADFEFAAYPISPIDTSIAQVTTHMNITSHNKLYFQNGRAARGMLVIKSEDVDMGVLNMLRQHFMNSINSVTSAWRTPIIGLSKEEEVDWVPMDPSHRDMEFQVLSENNTRAILSVFQISPDELPGYGHLGSRGGGGALGQAESKNEYKLEAARDVGIRPLIGQFQDFFNRYIFPLVDEELSKICVIQFKGLDALSPEEEAKRLLEDANVHLTYNDILRKVEKPALPPSSGADIPLNPQFQAVMKSYMTFGEIQEYFMGKKGASKDPELAFYENQSWLAWQSMSKIQIPQAQKTNQSIDLQNVGQKMQIDQMGDQMESEAAQQNLDPNVGTVSEGVDQLGAVMKGEADLSISHKKLLDQQNMTTKKILEKWKSESREVVEDVKKILLTSIKKK